MHDWKRACEEMVRTMSLYNGRYLWKNGKAAGAIEYLFDLNEDDPETYPPPWVQKAWMEVLWHYSGQWRTKVRAICDRMGTDMPSKHVPKVDRFPSTIETPASSLANAVPTWQKSRPVLSAPRMMRAVPPICIEQSTSALTKLAPET